MSVESFQWKIVGIKPLIQSNPHLMWKAPEEDEEKLKTTKRKSLRGTDKESFLTAKNQLYVNDAGQHYHPAHGFWDGLLLATAGRLFGKKNALSVITQAVALLEDEFLLCHPESLGGKGKPKPMKGTEWQIDYRRAVNHNKNKGDGGVAVVAIRPKWKTWGGLLTLEVDMDIFSDAGVEGLTALLNIAGHQFGLGVGRKRVKAIVRQQPVWSGFGSGLYSAELICP